MDYEKLATEFLQNMWLLHKTKPQKKIAESMQGEIFVLQYLFRNDDEVVPIVPGDISGVMGISSARTAAALGSLESKGYVTREIDKNDRRRILVRITESGCELAQKHQQEMLENTVKMLTLLGEKDAKEYVRLTGKLTDICTNKMKSAKCDMDI